MIKLFGGSPYVHDLPFRETDDVLKSVGGNTGNMLFRYATARMFSTGFQSIPWDSPLDIINNKAHKLLVMPLSNQLGPHIDCSSFLEKLEHINVPIIGIGLGAQGDADNIEASKIPEGSWRWLEALIKKGANEHPNLALRGKMTLGAIARRGLEGHCIVGGCPSNFLNPSPILGRFIARRRANGINRIAVAAGNPHLAQFRRLEQSLVQLVTNSNGSYICQHPLDMIRLARREIHTISPATLHLYRHYLLPESSEHEFISWFGTFAQVFLDVPSWLEYVTHFDAVVGTRIHGVMAGIQAGIPGLCLYIDSRTRELCELMQIPHVPASQYKNGISLSEIRNILCAWDSHAYDTTRFQLASALAAFAKNNGAEVYGALKSIHMSRVDDSIKFKEKAKTATTHQLSVASRDDRYPELFNQVSKISADAAAKILSYGCSDGFELEALAKIYYPSAHVYGCDVDDEALMIARRYNTFPFRVRIHKSTPAAINGIMPFDVVFCLSVYCRWPETGGMNDISTFYPFSKFEEGIRYLVSLISEGGLLCVYNANYRVTDTDSMQELSIVNSPDLPRQQMVKLFNNKGIPFEKQILDACLFRKNTGRTRGPTKTPRPNSD